ncbi:hypothetical protein FAVG1_04248 [Fusarium avenaceum]|nr:hypothetical protein FAVG1_04248 [Fusarium avenaceum]
MGGRFVQQSNQQFAGIRLPIPSWSRHALGFAEGIPQRLASLQRESLMCYIATLEEAKQDTYYRLPPPPPFVKWTTASPNRNERFSKFLRHRRDGTPLSLRCLTDDHKWGRTEEALRQEAPGILIYRRLNRPPTDIVGASPIEGVKFG